MNLCVSFVHFVVKYNSFNHKGFAMFHIGYQTTSGDGFERD